MSAKAGKNSREAYVLERQIGFLLRLANQRHAGIFQNIMPGRLTPTQFAALAKLHEAGACSQNHLGRMTAMDAATVKGVIDRLSAQGLVALKPDPQDRRRTAISLSKKGEKLITAALPGGFAVSEKTLEPLSVNERKTLVRLLKTIT